RVPAAAGRHGADRGRGCARLVALALDHRERDETGEQGDRREAEQALRHDGGHYDAFGGATTRRPSSASCASVIGDGAPLIGSTPAWFLGNAITSRKFGSPARTIVSRSMPSAMPPCGGAP